MSLKKSEIKRAALVNATIKLVNNQGFHDAPMSKIAKLATVSPATIYLYFENKQDLINQVYLEVKSLFVKQIFEDYHNDIPVEQGFNMIWHRIAVIKLKEVETGYFLSQCENTPIIDESARVAGIEYLRPLLDLWDRGKLEGLIKPLSNYILYAYSVYPLAFLMHTQKRGVFTITQQHLQDAYQAAWDSIKITKL